MTIRYTVYFKGRVQGVGFRHSASQVAKRHELAGVVQNLADGRVKLVAEGNSNTLNRFIADIKEQMSGFISDTLIEQSPATGAFGPVNTGSLSVQH